MSPVIGVFIQRKPHCKNLCTEVSATAVIGPLVSSDLITSKKGCKYSNVSTKKMSGGEKTLQFVYLCGGVTR